MGVTMTTEEMNEFLNEPWLTFVSTLTPNTGHPHVTPIWSYYDGDYFYMTLMDGNPKTRALVKDNRVALAIGNDALPFKAVLVHGTAELVREDMRPIIRRISKKYVGEDQADAITDLLLNDPQVIAKVTPTRIYAWDQSKVDFTEVAKAEKSGAAFRVL
ncbi:MAG: pyridoxamine 5'-phosphate oxidase family protein [Chloroflexi bacterium]|nr:pyridoxamine 5'-phosphate oxidase family protein [Chloroflexota bacterium]